MESLVNEILDSLILELGLENKSDIAILTCKVKSAYRETKSRRNYQPSHSKSFIENDMQNFYSNIKEVALYDFNQVGAEGQSGHSENGINRSWRSREDCFCGIVAFCGAP